MSCGAGQQGNEPLFVIFGRRGDGNGVEVSRGPARGVAAYLRARRQTVCRFLAERCGIEMGERKYWYDPRRTAVQADLTDFLRMLMRASNAIRPRSGPTMR